jgi:uncharacterized protein YjbJ (UPF0337 family)
MTASDSPDVNFATPSAAVRIRSSWRPSARDRAEAMVRWREQVGAAKLAWGRLTEEELLQVEGHAGKLTDLLQQRYAVNRDIAARQVQSFFDKP